MHIKAILFDMDGTIIDTEIIWHKATKNMLKKRSIILSDDHIETMKDEVHGLSVLDCCKYLKLEFNLDDSIEHLVMEKTSIGQQLFAKEVRFIDGFTTFFKQVLAHKLKTAIATNANDATIESTNNALNLRHYFGNHIYGVSCVPYGKPDPAIYQYTALQLQVDPQECIVIEDSKHGIEAAKNANMFCIGINTAKKLDYLSAADHIVDHYNELDLQRILKEKH